MSKNTLPWRRNYFMPSFLIPEIKSVLVNQVFQLPGLLTLDHEPIITKAVCLKLAVPLHDSASEHVNLTHPLEIAKHRPRPGSSLLGMG